MGARAVAVLLAAALLLGAAPPSPATGPVAPPPGEPAGARPSFDVLEAPPVLPPPAVPVVEVPVPDDGIVLVATPSTSGVARALAPRLADERRDLAAILGADLVAPLEIRLGHGRAEFAGLLPGGTAPAWASGLAYPALGLVIVDVQASARGGSAAQVLRHEIAHVALARAGGGRLPRWFSEGFAILHAGEWSFSRSATLARAVGADALLPVADLERGWPSSPTDVDLAYAQSVSLVTFLLRVEDGAAVRRLVAQLGTGHPFDTAFAAAFGQPVAGAEIDWKRSLRSRWGWLPVAFDPNLAWGLAAVLLVLGALRIRLHRKRRLARLPDDPADDPLPPEDDGLADPAAAGAGDAGPRWPAPVRADGEEPGHRDIAPRAPADVRAHREEPGPGGPDRPPAGDPDRRG